MLFFLEEVHAHSAEIEFFLSNLYVWLWVWIFFIIWYGLSILMNFVYTINHNEMP